VRHARAIARKRRWYEEFRWIAWCLYVGLTIGVFIGFVLRGMPAS